MNSHAKDLGYDSADDFNISKFLIDSFYLSGRYSDALDAALRTQRYHQNPGRPIREINELIVRAALRVNTLESLAIALEQLQQIDELQVTDIGIIWLKIQTFQHLMQQQIFYEDKIAHFKSQLLSSCDAFLALRPQDERVRAIKAIF